MKAFNIMVTRSRSIIVTLPTPKMSFFSLGIRFLPSSFGCDGPALVLAFQLDFQGVEGLNHWLC